MPDETVDDAADQPDEGVADGAADDTASGLEEPTQDEPAAGDLGDETASQDLTDEELETLRNDPAELRKAVMRAKDYTKKTTELARMRDFVSAYERDPQGTARRFAAAHGIKITDDAAPSSAAVQSARDRVAAVLGDEAADALLPVFKELAQSEVASTRQNVEHILGQTALTQAESVLDSFTAQVPDWRKLEPAMVKLSQEIAPKRGMDPLKYMKYLHMLASAGSSRADQVRKLTDRVTTAVRGSEPRTTGTSSSRVNERPNRLPTFDEAWGAASRGKRLEF